ncbi:MAG: nucleotide exchange factor GrpE [bacterium]|nr:nucleotide exchange factor GrpE [bacterium]
MLDMREENKDEIEIASDDEQVELRDLESDERAEGQIAKLRSELAECRKEKQEYMDGWQRAKADYVNSLKRFDEEKKQERTRGVLQAAEALLPALDALERARNVQHQVLDKMPDGFEAIARQLESAFAALGLESVGGVGEAFDPALHEALGTDAAQSAGEDNTVSVVLEKGWRLGDRFIRPAKVRVAHFEKVN